jgi:hypothetical protein
MNSMTNGDLVLVLDDILGDKQGMLAPTMTFQIFKPSLEERRDVLSLIREALKQRPLTEAFAEADTLYDSTARAAHYICRGLASLSLLSEDDRALIRQTAETFVPDLTLTTAAYEDEADNARRQAGTLEEMKSALEAFPIAPGITMYSLLAAHVEAGHEIGRLLTERAAITAEDASSRVSEAGVLRSRTIGELNQFRDTLSREIEANPSLPRDLETKVFALYDQLNTSRTERRPTKSDAAPESELTSL